MMGNEELLIKAAFVLVCLLMGIILAACGLSQAELDVQATRVAADIFATLTAGAPTLTPTRTPTATPTAAPAPTETPTPTPVLHPGWTSYTNVNYGNDIAFDGDGGSLWP